MKIFITKHALTKGIIEAEVDEADITCEYQGKTYWKPDFHLTKIEAVKDSISRKEKRLKSLRKQVSKLEKLSFLINK